MLNLLSLAEVGRIVQTSIDAHVLVLVIHLRNRDGQSFSLLSRSTWLNGAQLGLQHPWLQRG